MNYGDPIQTLRVDSNTPTNQELQLVNQLFHEEKSTMDKLVHELKDALIAGVLFAILSVPWVQTSVDGVMGKIIPICADNWIASLCVRTLIFMVLFYFITYYYKK